MFLGSLSFQVHLGIILKDEKKVSDMVDILLDHHQYVPSSSANIMVDVPGQSEEEMRLDAIHKLLYFGDQLTAECIRGAQAIRSNSENDIERLEGIIPAITDWHTKVSFLGVSFYVI